MAQTAAPAIKHYELYLPFERFVRNKIVHGRLWTLFLWELGGLLACAIVFDISLHGDFRTLFRTYAAAIFVGVTAINCDIWFLIKTSFLIRSKLPEMIALLPTESARGRSTLELSRLIYNRRTLAICATAVFCFGVLTFVWLGIKMPSPTTTILTLVAIGLIFVLLGLVVGVSFGFWRWMHRFGNRKPHIDVLHPDKMGGLKPIDEISNWVLRMGAVLTAFYSAGAYFSPYAHTEWRPYAYLWVVFATLLLVTAYFIPAFSVYRCLHHAQEELAKQLALHTERLYAIVLKDRAHSADFESNLIAVLWFGEVIKKLNLWPLRQTTVKVLEVFLLQLLPLALEIYLPHVLRSKP